MLKTKLNWRIIGVHFLFWAVYFSFFMYQINPMSNREGFGGLEKNGINRPPPPPRMEGENNFMPPPKQADRQGRSQHEPKVRNLTTVILDSIAHVIFMLLICYLNYFYFLPRFLKHRNLWRYFGETLLPFLLTIGLLIIVKSYFSGEFLEYKTSFNFSIGFIIELILSTLFILIFISMLKITENWVTIEAQKKELENEQLKMELSLLKAQINPHFLFNAFNNLYALAIQNAPQTPQIIEKLAQIMRYTLYESNRSEVSLQKEITLIENIIALERLHLGESGKITFEKEIENAEKIKIAPMILITFLENAFKHGSKGAKTYVEIMLRVEDNMLIYDIKNEKELRSAALEKSGIGLKNVQRQLELYYQNRYTLSIIETDISYRIQLKIKVL